jgi:hypothetical protein
MGGFWRILAKKEKITGILRGTEEICREKRLQGCRGFSDGSGCLPVTPCQRILKKRNYCFSFCLCESAKNVCFSRGANMVFDNYKKTRENQLFRRALIVNIAGFFLWTSSSLGKIQTFPMPVLYNRSRKDCTGIVYASGDCRIYRFFRARYAGLQRSRSGQKNLWSDHSLSTSLDCHEISSNSQCD